MTGTVRIVIDFPAASSFDRAYAAIGYRARVKLHGLGRPAKAAAQFQRTRQDRHER
jgi:hypothetical protein